MAWVRANNVFNQRTASIRGNFHAEQKLLHCILRVFGAFAEEAYNLAMQRVWTAEKFRSECLTFLRTLAVDAKAGLTDVQREILADVQRRIELSKEWKRYTRWLLEVAGEAGRDAAGTPPRGGKGSDRRAMVERFMASVKEATGHRIIRKDIWTVAGYENPTEFERFQRGASRTTRSAASNFTRVLNMSPEDFIRDLGKKKK